MSNEPGVEVLPTPELPVKTEKPVESTPVKTAVAAAQGTAVETGVPADQMQPSILRKCRYVYGVSLRVSPQHELFTVSVIEDSPKMVLAKMQQVISENVRNPELYILRIKSIDVLE